MKWKRSRKAKEQAAQLETDGCKSGKRETKPKDLSRCSAHDDDEDLDAEEEDEEEEEEEEFRKSINAGVGLPHPSDFLQHSSALSYSSHGSYSDDDLEEIGGDRKIRLGLWRTNGSCSLHVHELDRFKDWRLKAVDVKTIP